MTNTKLSRVTRLGTGLAVVIPVAVLRSLSIKRGDYVVFGVYDENTVVFRKVSSVELDKMKPTDLEF